MNNIEYGIVRISTSKQDPQRQIRNILAKYPKAQIIEETYTGTKLEGRTAFQKVLATIKEGDTLIFDSVSRMSRNSKEGVELYEQLFNKGVNIVFLKESYINTEVYRQAIENQIKVDFNIEDKATNELITTMINALNKYTIELLRKQLEEVFAQSQKEVDDLHQRTSERTFDSKIKRKKSAEDKKAKKLQHKKV